MPSFSECGISPLCWTKGWIAGGAKAVAESVVDMVASAIATAAESVLGFVANALMLKDNVEVGKNESVAWLQSNLHWLTSILAVLSVIVAGGMMVWHQRGSPLKDLGRSLGTLVIVSAAAVTGIDLATSFADSFAAWLLRSSGGMNNLAANMSLFLAATGGLGSFLIIILGLIAIVGGIIQVCLLLVRSVLLLLMAGVFPLSASATNTEWGQQWFKKSCSWIVAFVAYKPTVAIIFSFGIRMLKTSGVDAKTVNEKIKDICDIDDPSGEDYKKCIEDHPDEFASLKANLMDSLTGFLQGLIFLLLAVAALSAIMKFIVPAMSAISAGSGAAAAGAAGAVGGAVIASGARNVSGGGASSAPAGAQGAPGTARGASDGSPGGSGPPGGNGRGSPDRGTAAGAQSSGEGAKPSSEAAAAGGAAVKGGAAAATGGASVALQVAQAGGQVASGARDAAAGQTGETDGQK